MSQGSASGVKVASKTVIEHVLARLKEGLSQLTQKVLDDSRYRNRPLHFLRVIAGTRGLDLAADLIEQVFLTRTAVFSV